MQVQILSEKPDTAALLQWARDNALGEPGTIRFPITVDYEARTIGVKRAHSLQRNPMVADHLETFPLLVDLPEAVMAKVGWHEESGCLAYGVSNLVVIG